MPHFPPPVHISGEVHKGYRHKGYIIWVFKIRKLRLFHPAALAKLVFLKGDSAFPRANAFLQRPVPTRHAPDRCQREHADWYVSGFFKKCIPISAFWVYCWNESWTVTWVIWQWWGDKSWGKWRIIIIEMEQLPAQLCLLLSLATFF